MEIFRVAVSHPVSESAAQLMRKKAHKNSAKVPLKHPHFEHISNGYNALRANCTPTPRFLVQKTHFHGQNAAENTAH